MDLSSFNITRSILFTVLAGIICYVMVASGESRWWWLAVPAAGIFGGYARERPLDSSDFHDDD